MQYRARVRREIIGEYYYSAENLDHAKKLLDAMIDNDKEFDFESSNGLTLSIVEDYIP